MGRELEKKCSQALQDCCNFIRVQGACCAQKAEAGWHSSKLWVKEYLEQLFVLCSKQWDVWRPLAKERIKQLLHLARQWGVRAKCLGYRLAAQGKIKYKQIKVLTSQRIAQGKIKYEQIKVLTSQRIAQGKIKYEQIKALISQRADAATAKVRACYAALSSTWQRNQLFSLWLIPADGQHVSKACIKKSHIKYAAAVVAAIVFGGSATLAHYMAVGEQQKQELAAYRKNKEQQEQSLAELRELAEANQKELAALAKLEEQVRRQMEQGGAKLPPQNNASAYAGQGGPLTGDVDQLSVVLQQEKNIQRQINAKKADLQSLLAAIKTENYRREVTPSQWPTSGGSISSSFGGRTNPFSGYGGDWHPGIDIAVDYGEPVYASASGYVQQAGWYGGYGRYVRLGHDFGYQTAYGHMSRIACSVGEYVKKGQVIGYVGSSGYSTGPHLHFEVIRDGKQVNPSTLM